MISLKGKKVVDLTAELVARVARMDGTIELGSPDVYGHGWLCEETINNKDGTIEHLVGADMGAVADWPIVPASAPLLAAESIHSLPRTQPTATRRCHRSAQRSLPKVRVHQTISSPEHHLDQ